MKHINIFLAYCLLIATVVFTYNIFSDISNHNDMDLLIPACTFLMAIIFWLFAEIEQLKEKKHKLLFSKSK